MQYLQEYASDIISMIRLDRRVVNNRLTESNECHGWDVTKRAKARKENKTGRYDAVIAANGYCDWPLLPDIEGLEAWSKEIPDPIDHAVSYNNAKTFEKKVSKHLVGLLIRFNA